MKNALVRALIAGSAAAVPVAGVQAQWSPNPATNLVVAGISGDQVQPKIVATADGGCYISWFDNRTGGYDVYMQRLDAAGVPQWAANGILIADRGLSSTTDYDLIVDAAGHAVITYNDDQVAPGTQQIVVQRVDAAGNLLWGPAGVSVSDGSNAFKGNPHVCQLSGGGYAVAYTQNSTIVMQRLTGAGAPVWPGAGVTISETGSAYVGVCDLHAAESDRFILGWSRARTTSALTNKSLYAQKFDGDGQAVWSGTGVSVNAGSPVVVFDAGTTTGLQNGYFPPFLPDGGGGAIFAWYETGGERHAYLQHVLANGTLKFPAAVANTGSTPGRIRLGAGLAYDGGTGAYYVASPESNASPQGNYSVIVQKFDDKGARQWGETGTVVLPTGTGNQPSFVQCLPASDGCFVLGIDSRSATTGVVFGARVAFDGKVAWSNLPSSTEASKSRLVSAMSAGGFAMLAWGDGASGGSSDIQAQNVNPDGSFGIPAQPCYANCDGSTVVPVLNVNDFVCFQQRFAAGDSYANCDGSTVVPVLNVNDFVCFQQRFAAGCGR